MIDYGFLFISEILIGIGKYDIFICFVKFEVVYLILYILEIVFLMLYLLDVFINVSLV